MLKNSSNVDKRFLQELNFAFRELSYRAQRCEFLAPVFFRSESHLSDEVKVENDAEANDLVVDDVGADDDDDDVCVRTQ